MTSFWRHKHSYDNHLGEVINCANFDGSMPDSFGGVKQTDSIMLCIRISD